MLLVPENVLSEEVTQQILVNCETTFCAALLTETNPQLQPLVQRLKYSVKTFVSDGPSDFTDE